MNVQRIGYQPNFQAKFIKNQAMLEFTKEQVSNGREEELRDSLNKLSQRHSNTALLLTKEDDGNSKVTNLYNDRSIVFEDFNTDSIETLSNIKSYEYKTLFGSDKVMTPARTTNITNSIANKYFIDSAPDYTWGHKLDQIF